MAWSVRELADAVLATLRNPRVKAGDARRLGLSPEGLAILTERFLNEGIKAVLLTDPPLPTWRQLGVSFRARANAATFGAALGRAVRRWQAKGVVGRFFFMQKPPGLRLRFETKALAGMHVARRHRDGHARPLPFLERWLLGRPEVARIERSIYLAETYQFGGERGADVAHDFHAGDSLRALDARDRDRRGVSSASMEILSLLIVCDLVNRMTDDVGEAWDVWKRMEVTGRRTNVRREKAEAMIDLVRPFVRSPAAVLRRLSVVDRKLVASAHATNARVAKAMRGLAARGELLFHVREILPFWIIFHWNRWGIVNQQALTIGIEGALDPRS